MGQHVMLGLGPFRFELDTLAYQRLQYTDAWRWPQQPRIGRDPALQFVGRDSGEITLDGVIYPSFRGGLGQIEAIKAMADEGQPLLLVDGLGRIWGRWCIVKVGDVRTIFADHGQPRKIEFTIELKRYGEDRA